MGIDVGSFGISVDLAPNPYLMIVLVIMHPVLKKALRRLLDTAEMHLLIREETPG